MALEPKEEGLPVVRPVAFMALVGVAKPGDDVEQTPIFWRDLTRPTLSSRLKQQSK